MNTNAGVSTTRRPKTPTAALLLLSLLWALPTLRAGLLPGSLFNPPPSFERQAVLFAMLSFVSGFIAQASGAELPRAGQFRNLILVGLGLFVAPAGLIYLSDRWVSGLTRAALFTLTPVFEVVFEPYLCGAGDRQTRGAIPAAISAFAGALCVFPITFPGSIASGSAFGAVLLATACVAAANCLGVAAATVRHPKSISWIAAIAGFTATVTFSIASAFLEQPTSEWNSLASDLLWSAAVELPGLLMLFWLMARMSATRMATRYVLAPLFAIVVGAALLQSLREKNPDMGGNRPYGRERLLASLRPPVGSRFLEFAPDSEQEIALPDKLWANSRRFHYT